eukprot:1319125-Alexandrium_andersonii.AAC.1
MAVWLNGKQDGGPGLTGRALLHPEPDLAARGARQFQPGARGVHGPRGAWMASRAARSAP